MKKIFSAIVALVILGCFAPAAAASPTFTYGFKVTSYICYLVDCVDETFYTEKLESMTLDLTLKAAREGEAKLHYATYERGTGAPVYVLEDSNQGFSSVNLSAWKVSLDLVNGICEAYFRCNVEADLDVSVFLRGLFRIDTDNDNVYMSASETSLWTGYIHSDGPYMTSSPGFFPTFEGEWILVRVVPEPGTTVLFATALVGLGLTFRRNLSTSSV